LTHPDMCGDLWGKLTTVTYNILPTHISVVILYKHFTHFCWCRDTILLFNGSIQGSQGFGFSR